MSTTRFRLGKGLTIGSSGLRYGRRLGKIWVSTGRSGTLVAGYGVRHWEPAKRSGVADWQSGPSQPSTAPLRASEAALRRNTILVSLLGWAVIVAGITWIATGAHASDTYGATVYPHALTGGFLVVEGFALWAVACAVRHGMALARTLILAPLAIVGIGAFLLLLLCI